MKRSFNVIKKKSFFFLLMNSIKTKETRIQSMTMFMLKQREKTNERWIERHHTKHYIKIYFMC